MALTASQRDLWRHRWAVQRRSLEERRHRLLILAAEIALGLRGRWPGVSVWLFGSMLGPGFRAGSDLDLAVEGLPAEALLEAQRLAEDLADAAAGRDALAPIAVDVVRLEALPQHWRDRIRAAGQPLL